MSMTPSRAKNAIGRSLSQIIFGCPVTSDKRQIWQFFIIAVPIVIVKSPKESGI